MGCTVWDGLLDLKAVELSMLNPVDGRIDNSVIVSVLYSRVANCASS
jgi:hypothetical protein